MARVLICDSHDAVRTALSLRISGERDLKLVDAVSSAGELMDELKSGNVDVVVLELMLPDSIGLDVVRHLTEQYPDIPIVVYTMYDEAVYAERAVRAGACGYVMKKQGTAEVADAVRAALEREVYVGPRIAARLEEGETELLHPTNALTDVEMAVFQLLGHGFATDVLAERLQMSGSRVREMQDAMTKKLDLPSNESLVQYAGRIVHQ